jgi:23S rRNA pseudouridine2605 synthase
MIGRSSKRSMRLNRFLARAGIASRRAAEDLIRTGRVVVNGAVTTALATDVDPARDRVEVEGRHIALPATTTTIILNKPPGFVVTLSDPQGRPTVADLLKGVDAHVVPIGRLDAATEGLLLLTDDGDLAHRVSHPSFGVDKVYEVLARGALSEEDRRILEEGVDLDGRKTAPASVRVLSEGRGETRAEVRLHEGRKRQVRRMFEAVGHPVRRLRRTKVGPVELGGLPLGRWRRATAEEIGALREAVGLSSDGPPSAGTTAVRK